MDVSGVSQIAQAAPVAATPVARDASQNRQVVQAVKALNKSELFGEENGLEFQKDPDTKRMIVKIVNRETGEVISQIPPEYVSRLAESLSPKQSASLGS
jgi:flagellar protein FlaG